jgi:hypothetical protein
MSKNIEPLPWGIVARGMCVGYRSPQLQQKAYSPCLGTEHLPQNILLKKNFTNFALFFLLLKTLGNLGVHTQPCLYKIAFH